uniref:Uncharacterized protein n=1 Tax=Oryza nivara TaxID=4536 RepID=A0A679BB93_ORYNI|nr:hypothetical protein [Oryza sativa f. spontanea]
MCTGSTCHIMKAPVGPTWRGQGNGGTGHAPWQPPRLQTGQSARGGVRWQRLSAATAEGGVGVKEVKVDPVAQRWVSELRRRRSPAWMEMRELWEERRAEGARAQRGSAVLTFGGQQLQGNATMTARLLSAVGSDGGGDLHENRKAAAVRR